MKNLYGLDDEKVKELNAIDLSQEIAIARLRLDAKVKRLKTLQNNEQLELDFGAEIEEKNGDEFSYIKKIHDYGSKSMLELIKEIRMLVNTQHQIRGNENDKLDEAWIKIIDDMNEHTEKQNG